MQYTCTRHWRIHVPLHVCIYMCTCTVSFNVIIPCLFLRYRAEGEFWTHSPVPQIKFSLKTVSKGLMKDDKLITRVSTVGVSFPSSSSSSSSSSSLLHSSYSTLICLFTHFSSSSHFHSLFPFSLPRLFPFPLLSFLF